tara:strand:+ start:236 stop:451 length:216 start_codon:yes stop_codon:yes gene_type:complete
MNKIGSHITNLMLIIRDTEEKPFVRELALEDLKKLSGDISSFIFEWIDEIEDLTSAFGSQRKPNNQMELEL